ncbi:hypothetical protein DdX_20723 [Ditylenchus destructor]|uniref:Uncharacterized protein n=1 Tax=Ditylenchus destructor TaxID=166010 RepID=A0AAD4QW54_9BILA|nr:hypothetical protein DdX_20723 [Ditylenchus destructor]
MSLFGRVIQDAMPNLVETGKLSSAVHKMISEKNANEEENRPRNLGFKDFCRKLCFMPIVHGRCKKLMPEKEMARNKVATIAQATIVNMEIVFFINCYNLQELEMGNVQRINQSLQTKIEETKNYTNRGSTAEK